MAEGRAKDTDEGGEGARSRRSEPGGRRLAAAFGEVATFPALAESQARLLRLTARGDGSSCSVVAAVESDAALAIAVMRAANNGGGPPAQISNVPDAVELLLPSGVEAAASRVDTYEFFQGRGPWRDQPERFRRHALATRHAAERVAELCGVAGRDELVVAALLHDVGQLALERLYRGYRELLDDRDLSPEQRIARERRELGIDHALVGGVLVRRWNLPPPIPHAIEAHHSDEADDLAAVIRLADMVAHNSHGEAITAGEMRAAAAACGLGARGLQRVLYEFPYPEAPRRRASEPCPLSAREVDALRGLADGLVYKDIARTMGVSASTVRTHLHNVYRKIGAADRAQAVLFARDRAWI